MTLVQVEFTKSVDDQLWRRITWVDASHKLHKGTEVTFEDEEGRWKVYQIYKNTKIESHTISTKWGVNLPKSQRTER